MKWKVYDLPSPLNFEVPEAAGGDPLVFRNQERNAVLPQDPHHCHDELPCVFKEGLDEGDRPMLPTQDSCHSSVPRWQGYGDKKRLPQRSEREVAAPGTDVSPWQAQGEF